MNECGELCNTVSLSKKLKHVIFCSSDQNEFLGELMLYRLYVFSLNIKY